MFLNDFKYNYDAPSKFKILSQILDKNQKRSGKVVSNIQINRFDVVYIYIHKA